MPFLLIFVWLPRQSEVWKKDNLWTKTSEHLFLEEHVPLDKWKAKPKIYHFVQHTHTDAGYIETMATYQRIFVDAIVGNGTKELTDRVAFKEGKLTFANMDYLWSYRNRMGESKWQEVVRAVRDLKALKVVNDAVVMPDQALPYFDDLINNYEYGREFALREFGMLSRMAWAIDSFGSSSTTSRLMADMGFDLQVINRISESVRREIEQKNDYFLTWKQDYEEYDLMTRLLGSHYMPEVYTRHTMERMYNMHSIIHPEFDQLHIAYSLYTHNRFFTDDLLEENVPVLIGDDFAYNTPQKDFELLRELYVVIHSNEKSSMFGTYKFSHPEELFQAMRSENLTYNEFRGDFMPSINYHPIIGQNSWTGFYFTRPEFKLEIRLLSKFMRGCRS